MASSVGIFDGLGESVSPALDTSSPDALLPRLLTAITNPSSFQWQTGVTPFTHVSWPLAGIVGYLLVVWLLPKFMASREALNPVSITRAHNLLLTCWSFLMLAGTTMEVILAVGRDGYTLSELVCDRKNGVTGALLTGRLGFWAYNYYLSKYYEMLDTVVLIVRKKNLKFLHVYHHVTILFVTWSWNHTTLAYLWVGMQLNTCIHTFMYYYYYRASFSTYRPWWRLHLTKGQILQFIAGFSAAVYWDVLSLKNVQFVGEAPFLRYSSSDCAGAAWSVTISQLMLLSFVFLFGKFFYEENAKKQAEKAAKAAKAGSEDAAASSGVEDSGTDGAKFDSDGSPLQSTTTPKRGKGSGHDLRQRRSK